VEDSKKTFTVTFEANGGSSVDRQTVVEGDTVKRPSTPTKVGYTFVEWCSDAACTTPWDFTNGKVTGDTTLYARWSINRYTVTFETNGGSGVPSESVAHGSTVPQPADPTKIDYAFVGWYSDAACTTLWNFATNTVTCDTTLYAKWVENSKKTFTVTFEANGGSSVDRQTVVEGDTVKKPAPPTKAGHTFVGWYADANFATLWNFATGTVSRDTTLYAKWVENSKKTYTVTFDANGGSSVDRQTVVEGDTVKKPDAPTKAGYTFAGWYADAACTILWDFAADTVTANITLYAKWELSAYTVSFYTDGGSSVPSQRILHGEIVAKPENPVKPGYIFAGWYQDAAFATPWNFPTGRIFCDTTIYARWFEESAITHTVTFEVNGGSNIDPQLVADSGRVAQPVTPTRTGYDFIGWCTNAALTLPTWNFAYDLVTCDTTLHAKWVAKVLQLDSMVVNGIAFPVDYDTIRYAIPCDDDVQVLRITFAKTPPDADNSAGDTLTVDADRAFRIDTSISLSSIDGQTKRYTLTLEKHLDFSSFVHIQLGGKLLMAVKNPENNNGFDLTEAYWQRKVGDAWIAIGCDKFYYVPDPDRFSYDTVRIVVRDISGTWLSSCPYEPSDAAASDETLRAAVYPNPVTAGGVIYLKESFFIGAKLKENYANFLLLNVQGGVVKTGKTVELRQGLIMPTIPGMYHLILEGAAGRIQLKIAVGS
jgi:uncharacterized repeat protein (TIGR02543 family)